VSDPGRAAGDLAGSADRVDCCGNRSAGKMQAGLRISAARFARMVKDS
jgi:hypothetical protein